MRNDCQLEQTGHFSFLGRIQSFLGGAKISERCLSWTTICLGVLAAIIIGKILGGYSRYLSDFGLDYGAALVLGVGQSIYGEQAVELFKQATGIPGSIYFHPPFAAVFMWPWTLLPYPVAFILFGLCSLLLLLIITAILGRSFGVRSTRLLIVLVGLLCWYPVWATMATGQLSGIVAVCICGCWLALSTGKARLAGGLAALATLLKLYPGLLMIYFLFNRSWTVVRAMLLAIGIGLATSLMLVGYRDMFIYLLERMPQGAGYYRGHVLNISLTGAITKVLGPSSEWMESWCHLPTLAQALIWGAQVILILGLLWLSYRQRDLTKNGSVIFSIYCVVMLLLSPIVWQHYLLVLVLPLFTMASRWKLMACNERTLLVGAVIAVSIPDAWLVAALEQLGQVRGVGLIVFLLPTVGLVIIGILLVCQLSTITPPQRPIYLVPKLDKIEH